MKRVIIVGGGYAGTALARALDGVTDVVLIEPRDRFVHNVASIRAVVEPALHEKIALPYDKLLKRGKVVRDRAVAIADNGVKLAGGATIEGDIVVVATGSRYARLFKPQGDSIASFVAASRAAHAALLAAKSIAIVGAGAVGTELAGEIAAAFPKKKITLVSSTSTLFPAYPAKLGQKLEAQLKRARVSLRMGTTVRNLQSVDEPTSGKLEVSDGTTLDAEFIVPAIGAKPVNDLLHALPGAKADALGRVEVDAWLRLPGRANVFALGDAAATGDAMTIVGIAGQEPWLAKTIKAVVAGKKIESLPRYKPSLAPPILIPLGPSKGASVLPFGKKGLVVGSFFTSILKGKHLFIPRYRKAFGVV